MRLSKAPRKVYPHADVDALREVLREAGEQGRDGDGRALPADPRRHRRRVQHGRRHRAAARDRRGGRGVRRGGHGRRRPRVGRARAERPRLRRPLRAPRPGRDPGRDAVARPSACSAATSRDRRRCATSSIQRARPFLFSTSHPPAVVAACREAIRVMQDEPELHRAAVGEHPPVQGRARPARLRHRRARETPITPVMMGDSETADRFSDRLFEEGVFAQPVVFPTVAIDKARIRTIVTAAHTDEQLDRALAAFDRVGPRAGPDRRVTSRHARRWAPGSGRHATARRRRARRVPGGHRGGPRRRPRPAARLRTSTRSVARQRRRRSTPTRARPSSAGSPSSRSPTTSTSTRRCPPTASPRSRTASGSSARRPSAGPSAASRSASASRSPTTARTRRTSATASPGTRTTSSSAPSTISADSPYKAGQRGRVGSAGRSLAEIVAPYFDEVIGAARSGLFDTHRPPRLREALPRAARHARRTSRPPRSCTSRSSRALVESGTALEVNTTRPPPAPARDVSVGGDRRPLPRARRPRM